MVQVACLMLTKAYARNLSGNPGRSVELVSKLPVTPEKKVQLLRNDVLRHLPMSASKKVLPHCHWPLVLPSPHLQASLQVELLRDVPLAPSNTRVENWTNQIIDQLPLPK